MGGNGRGELEQDWSATEIICQKEARELFRAKDVESRDVREPLCLRIVECGVHRFGKASMNEGPRCPGNYHV